MNNVRTERMLRELHAGPPFRLFEDVAALRDIVARLVARNRKPGGAQPHAEIAEPALAGVAGGASRR